MIESAFETLIITSAGGDSPKQNRPIDYEISSADFQSILEDSIRDVVNDTLEERELVGPPGKKKDDDGFDLPGIGQIGSMIKNPTGAITSRLLAATGAAGVIAMLIKPVTEAVIGELTRPGGFLDKRFRREMLNEIEFYLSRQQQQLTRIGERNVIIQAKAGFANQNQHSHDSIVRRIAEDRGDEYRVSGIGLNDRASGLKAGP